MTTPRAPLDVAHQDYVPGSGEPVRMGDEVSVIYQARKLSPEGIAGDTLVNVEDSNMETFVLSMDKAKIFFRLFHVVLLSFTINHLNHLKRFILALLE